LLEVFGHDEIVVELEMATVLFGFGAERDDDDCVRCENAFGFVPGKSFEKRRSACMRRMRCRRNV